MLWSSIVKASSEKQPPISFSDVFEGTKALHRQTNIEQSLIIAADNQRKQSPSRMAKLITHLNGLPYGLSETHAVSSLLKIYIECYEMIAAIQPITSITDCDAYYKAVREFLVHQLLAIPKLCHGILEKSAETDSLFLIDSTGDHVSQFVNRFATQRLATRVMSAHNLTLYEQIKSNSINKMGVFEEHCDVMKYVQQAIIDSDRECKRHFIDVVGLDPNKVDLELGSHVKCMDKRSNKKGTNFVYIAQHLHRMIFELLKNSMRAVVESESGERRIDIVVVDSVDGSITVKISDVGGGISRSLKDKIWYYGYTTEHDCDDDAVSCRSKMLKQMDLLDTMIKSAQKQQERLHEHYDEQFTNNEMVMSDASVLSAAQCTPMCGLGYGLPICKMYANFFGGNCKIHSVHGYGTDAYLFLSSLSECDIIIM